jgi:putative transposase
LHRGLANYFDQFNTNRRHSSIGDKYPIELYMDSRCHRGQTELSPM